MEGKALLSGTAHDTIVVCPVYNEQKYLDRFYSQLKIHYPGDVVFIDDGSTDRGIEILRKSMGDEERDRMHILTHDSRHGYGLALMSGFRYALGKTYKKIITIDADLQHQPEDIHRFIAKLDTHAVVLGSRYLQNPSPPHVPKARLIINRYISSFLGEFFSRDGFVMKLTDSFCGFRGYRRNFLYNARLTEKSYGIALEILFEILRLKVEATEITVKPIYFDDSRIFRDDLNDPYKRLNYYKEIIARKVRELEHYREKLFVG
jgi:dolichol-phosphate mannosyltransferase